MITIQELKQLAISSPMTARDFAKQVLTIVKPQEAKQSPTDQEACFKTKEEVCQELEKQGVFLL